MGSYSPNIIANSLICCHTHNADGEFVVYGDKRYSWGKVVPRVFKIAQALIKLGVRKEDKVAFMFHNTPEFIEVNCGIQVAEAIPTPMNYRYVTREVEFQGQHSDANVLIYDSIWAEAVEPVIPNLTGIKHFICLGKSGDSKVISYDEFVNSGEEKDPAVANDWKDVAVMIYTGGTTGFPKGVMLTYQAHVEMYSTFLSHVVSPRFSLQF
ncbi:MAG: AMP-binding protein [Deltaproteobacteria bacterium]|nr:AMP-binding protein [Deltaproteobacteria bacterium]MBW2201147.1 AMP-binding protein [Deltaproteobacteria bacterium]